MAKLDLFAIVKSISEPGGEADLLVKHPENIRGYSPFMINRSLAQSISTIMFAQEANKEVVLDPTMHYGFMFHSVKKSKRYSKWAKKEAIPDKIKLIQEAYGCSLDKAMELAELIGPEEEKVLLQRMDKGGVQGRQPAAKKEAK